MDDIRVGLIFRAIRRSKGLSQATVGSRAGVSQQLISRLERGRIADLTVRRVRSIGAVLEVEMPFGPRWRGPELQRLLDADHAILVGLVVSLLRELGWTVLVEWSFNHFGERGSVDVVAWHPTFRTLLVVEVKTRIVDLQDLLSTHDRKVRIAARLLAEEQGWRPSHMGRVVVLPNDSTTHDTVRRHRAVLDAVLPTRTVAVKSWLGAPERDLAGLWFVRPTTPPGKSTRHTVVRRGDRA